MKGHISKLSRKPSVFKRCVDLFCIENACHPVALRYLRFGCSNISLSVSWSVYFNVPIFFLFLDFYSFIQLFAPGILFTQMMRCKCIKGRRCPQKALSINIICLHWLCRKTHWGECSTNIFIFSLLIILFCHNAEYNKNTINFEKCCLDTLLAAGLFNQTSVNP